MTTMRDISIRCDALGKRYDAPVIAIGAVFFDRDTGKLGEKFYQEITLDSAIRSGQVDGSTLSWWVGQSPKAHKLFNGDPAKKMALSSALHNFVTFCRGPGGAPRTWGSGATAEMTWLEHAIHKGSVGLSVPWHIMNIRDMLTIVEAAGIAHRLGAIHAVETHHDALDDAIRQAMVISEAWQRIRRGLKGVPEDVPMMAPIKRYWHHPESDAYFVTENGEGPGDCADGQLCHEITKAKYDEAT
jgi:hypothetical protein